MRFDKKGSNWCKIFLKDAFTFLSNNTLSRDNLTYIEGKYKTIHYGDILTKYGTVKNINDSDVPFISDRIKCNNDILRPGDIVIADTAEDYTVGKSIEIAYSSSIPAYSGLHTIALRPIIKFAEGFIAYYFNSKAFKKRIYPLIQGIKVYSISKTNLSNCIIKYPSYNTQLKITILLKKIDDRIITQKKIIEDYESLKETICNNIFKAQLGTKYPLSLILFERNIYSEKNNKYTHVTLSKDGIIPKTDRYNRDFLVRDENKEYKITKMNDLCYNPANLKFGVICKNNYGDAIFSPIYVTFEISKQHNADYVSMLLTNNTFIHKIRKYEQGTVYERMAVNPSDFLKGEIYLPNIEKQLDIIKKIKVINNKITIEKEILSLYKKQKQYLLNHMFI